MSTFMFTFKFSFMFMFMFEQCFKEQEIKKLYREIKLLKLNVAVAFTNK